MPPKRKRANENDDDATESKRYAHLKAQVRRVPEKTIKAKWTTLPEPVQGKVLDMFHSLERPVIMRNKNEQKRIEAQSAVQAVVRKYVYEYSYIMNVARSASVEWSRRVRKGKRC
jgi:kinetochore protein Fta7